jgi:hypothetical protein
MKKKLNDYMRIVKNDSNEINEGYTSDYVDHEELYMIMGDLRKINDLSSKLHYMMKKDPSCVEEWNQIKISRAADYLSSVYDYLTYTNVRDRNE